MTPGSTKFNPLTFFYFITHTRGHDRRRPRPRQDAGLRFGAFSHLDRAHFKEGQYAAFARPFALLSDLKAITYVLSSQ
jgi:hypothetical protein